jgi:iron(III) transport system substrate-binding protein
MNRCWIRSVVVVALIGAVLGGCGETKEARQESSALDADSSSVLVLYSGRSESLVEPMIALFEKQTGIDVQVKYGNTPELALTLREEGSRGQADVFWAQDAGALGAVSKAELFVDLPADISTNLPELFRHAGGKWVATSARARTLAYSSERVKPESLPKSVFDLTDARFRGRVAWAPSNASFQSFVTAMRKMHGEDTTRTWLEDMKKNKTQAHANNVAILQAIARGDADYGLPNHYYLLNFKKTEAKFPVEQAAFAPGDVGNLINVAGMGILATSTHRDAAERFVRFVLSPTAQQYFASEVAEYPVVGDVMTNARLEPRDELLRAAPRVTLDDLDDLDGTLALLRSVGLL